MYNAQTLVAHSSISMAASKKLPVHFYLQFNFSFHFKINLSLLGLLILAAEPFNEFAIIIPTHCRNQPIVTTALRMRVSSDTFTLKLTKLPDDEQRLIIFSAYKPRSFSRTKADMTNNTCIYCFISDMLSKRRRT